MLSSTRRTAVLGALALVVGVSERPAAAHALGVSSGEYRLDGAVLYGDLGMASRALARLLPAIDADGDGFVSSLELAAGHDAVARALVSGLRVTADGRACPGALDRAWALEAEDGVVFQMRFVCPAAPGKLVIAAPILDSLPAGHRHMARLFRAGKAQVTVLDRAHAAWTLDSGSKGGSALAMVWSMLKLGVEHILTGADHLVFLFGLILVGGRLRSLVGVVSAFTLAHSITLALAALSIFTPSPRLSSPPSRSRSPTSASRTCSSSTPASAGASRFRSASFTASASPAPCVRSRCRTRRSRSPWRLSTWASRSASSRFCPSRYPSS